MKYVVDEMVMAYRDVFPMLRFGSVMCNVYHTGIVHVKERGCSLR